MRNAELNPSAGDLPLQRQHGACLLPRRPAVPHQLSGGADSRRRDRRLQGGGQGHPHCPQSSETT